ncbi:MAG TPA: malto-oligosyltrehalose trehalohydrolase [Geminicoccus sp.]|jgi:maltooligosyltrehalose trehalohydrolase|uniref:malto-oligosyltrehalose trehalohydrolase n=1 Tax=Geminicoccus sp. TaxID=2024832 RepID=UPI002E31C584|nr:malto-oligosyltrehalose trehalohydrolase [Geminicoccus sp.]HEX2529716.1 malto-oligosyltrehalose trehalohydrolase [Geminicoccus sp.]
MTEQARWWAHGGRRYPIGAEHHGEGTSFRIWAPLRATAAVVLENGREHRLEREPDGYHSAIVREADVGTRYRFRLDNDETLYPDPASRWQPEGPHGPSAVIDPTRFHWTDDQWLAVKIEGQVIYELHVGTFTPEATWAAATAKLPYLRDLGITIIEMMPVNEFPGRFGWGYDGVDLFAPTHLYGTPDELRTFVDTAHGLGIGVIMDVVYNHLGPDGNFLSAFCPDYFTDRYANEWGEAINFDGPNAAGVREFFTANAAYWIDEFHMDGLRLDATQSMFDSSADHIIAAVVRAARQAAGDRGIVLIGENEPQHTRLVRSAENGGYGLDGLWNDDLHRSAMVALTGHNEAYYEDHLGTPQEFISAAKYGFLFQGQHCAHQDDTRGTAGLDLAPPAMVTFIQNHDQVANSARGLRIHQLTSPGRARAMTALLLLLPGTPMLFQGQEFGASTPFLYFSDQKPDLADLVREGRHAFLGQFESITAEMRPFLADPTSPDVYERCKLDWSEARRNEAALTLHRDLLRMRREDPAFAAQRADRLDGAVLGAEAFVLRFFGPAGSDRLLLVNFGVDLSRASLPEPLLAPPEGQRWAMSWSSESPVYGGSGTAPVVTTRGWRVPGHAAVVLAASDDDT